MIFRSPAPADVRNSPSGMGSRTSGRMHLPDCFIAATQSFRQRSVFAWCGIVLSVRSGTIAAAPSSVAFSTR